MSSSSQEGTHNQRILTDLVSEVVMNKSDINTYTANTVVHINWTGADHTANSLLIRIVAATSVLLSVLLILMTCKYILHGILDSNQWHLFNFIFLPLIKNVLAASYLGAVIYFTTFHVIARNKLFAKCI